MDLFTEKSLIRRTSNEYYGKLIDLLDTYKLKGSTTSKTIMSGFDHIFNKVDLVVETRFVLMTPRLAKFILEEYNVENRPVSKINLQKLVKEMNDGHWAFNGDTIVFDYNGYLRNGQHRLHACIESNISFPVLVVSGLQPSSFMTMDIGRKRNGTDVLSIEGIKNAANASSAVKTIDAFKKGCYGMNVHTKLGALTNSEIVDLYCKLNTPRSNGPEFTLDEPMRFPLDEAIRYGLKMAKRDESLLQTSLVSTFYYLLTESDAEKGHNFMEQLCLGYNIEKGSPIQALRVKLLKIKTDKNYKLTHSDLIKNIVYAWQKYKNGEKCTNIRLPENFDMSL